MLLQRTPYNKQETEEESGDAPFFARHGYVCAVQDCRGCFASGGDLDFLLADAEDGADTVEWLGRQAFGNGRVGTWGTSWAGWTQTALAALAPSNLYTMVPNMSGSNAHNSSVRQGGAMELRFMAWAFWHSAYNTQAKLSADLAALNFGAPSFRDWLSRMPIRPGMTQLALVPAYERWVFDLFTRADYDEYWLHPSLNPQAHYDRFPDMPVLWVGGWYDSYTRGTIENFEGLEQTKSAPQHLLMGPWTHGHTTMQLDHAGDVEFGPEAAVPSFLAVQLRWFDRWLKGVGNGHRRRGAGAPVRDGRRRRTTRRQRATAPWRALARRNHLAAAARHLDRLLLPCERRTAPGALGRCAGIDQLFVRSGQASAFLRRLRILAKRASSAKPGHHRSVLHGKR